MRTTKTPNSRLNPGSLSQSPCGIRHFAPPQIGWWRHLWQFRVTLAKPASKEHPPSGFQQVLDVRVYYEDTDFSGNVYHASYLRFLERGRTELLRGLGIEHSRIFDRGGAKGCYFVVRAMTIEFLRPAIMDDSLLVHTRISRIGGASIEMIQEIRRGQEVLLTAKVRIAVVFGGKARRIPAEVLARLKGDRAVLVWS